MDAPLYNARILRLAAATADACRLEAPQGSATRRSPVCGSRVTVDVDLDEQGRVARLGQAVRACALGQASAAIAAAGAPGRTADELAAAESALRAWLAGGAGDMPSVLAHAFPDCGALAPAGPHRARHASILLAFEAAAEAARLAGLRATPPGE